MTGEDVIFALWRRCRATAQKEGFCPGEAVESLIDSSKEILTVYGASEHDINLVLSDIYTVVHWDWPEPTARVFETLLEFELAPYFAERFPRNRMTQ
jgi:hypothetical protein